MRVIAGGLAGAGLTLLLNVPTTEAVPITFSGSGSSPAGIQTTVDAFRTDLGTLNPNAAGSVGSGRREINWDAVPDAFAAPNNLPANFFNVNSPRGVVFAIAGTGFQVSANAVNPTNTPVLFGNINSTYPSRSGLRSWRIPGAREFIPDEGGWRILKRTRRWRKRDSNYRSLSRNEPVFPTEQEGPQRQKGNLEIVVFPARDQGFESPFLQRGAWCEHDFRERIPSLTGKDFANAKPQRRFSARK